MSPSPRACVCTVLAMSLAISFAVAALAACGDNSSAPPDAVLPAFPTGPAGVYDVTSVIDIEIPPAASDMIAVVTAATDGADDPARYLLDRMIALAPDGTWKTIAADAAPLVAAYLNEQLDQLAPRLRPGLTAIAGGMTRLASRLDTIETLEIDERGAAIRTIVGVRFDTGGSGTELRFADAGLPDLAAELGVALDAGGELTLGDHTQRLPYGALLRLGLDRAVVPAVAPSAHDLGGALAELVDCDQLSGLIYSQLRSQLGVTAPALLGDACRTALVAAASEVYARIAAIDETALTIELTGTASGLDLDGDGTMDTLHGRWSGSLGSSSSRQAIDAATFSGRRAPAMIAPR